MVTTVERFAGVRDGLGRKAPCRVATTANITLAGLQTIDGVTVVDADRVLVKNQSTATENGIYNASSGNWQRALDFNGNRDAVKGTAVFVTDGTTNGSVEFELTTANPVVFGSSNITFESAYQEVVAAAEAAADAAAVAAAAALGMVPTPNRTTLAALSTTFTRTAVIYDEGGRNGFFVWNAGNCSTYVTNDPGQGVWVPPASATSGASGCWQRYVEDGYSVEWFGATGDGVTNDYTAIQRAINYVGTLAGGTVLFKSGYKVDTGLVLNVALVKLQGVGNRRASIFSTTANINVITLTTRVCQVDNLSLFHQVRSTSACGIVLLEAGAVQCTISNCDFSGGYYCIYCLGTDGAPEPVTTTDNVVENCVFSYAIGGAMAYLRNAGAFFFNRCLFNQGWVGGTPAVGGTNDKGSRGNSTLYSLKDFVSSGGFLLQCTQAGTSGGSPPVLTGLWYDDEITDGTARWYIANNSAACAAVIDSGCTYVEFEGCDFTGAFFNAVALRDNLGTSGPDVARIIDCTSAAVVGNVISIEAAEDVIVDDCEFQVCVGNYTNEAAIYVGAGFEGEAIITNNRVRGGISIGVRLANATLGSVSINGGNQLFATSVGIYVDAGVSDFQIIGNNCGSSAVWGAPSQAITVAVGGSDNYHIALNRIFGAATGVSDGGSGSNKYVSGNI